MALWMDSLSHHMGMGGMGMMNMDQMMQWMDSIEFSGQWRRNASKDSCWFVADSMLLPDADHMVYMYGALRRSDVPFPYSAVAVAFAREKGNSG